MRAGTRCQVGNSDIFFLVVENQHFTRHSFVVSSNQHNTRHRGSIFSTESDHQSRWGCSNSQPSPCQTVRPLLENTCLRDAASHAGALGTQTAPAWNLRWGKLLGRELIHSNSLLYGFNTSSEYISKTLQDFFWRGGRGACICSAFVLDCLKLSSSMFPLHSFELKLLSLLSMEPKALLSRFPERSSRYHGANSTFGSD